MADLTGWETVRYGLPKAGEHYLVLDDEDEPVDAMPRVNETFRDHDIDATPRVIVRRIDTALPRVPLDFLGKPPVDDEED